MHIDRDSVLALQKSLNEGGINKIDYLHNDSMKFNSDSENFNFIEQTLVENYDGLSLFRHCTEKQIFVTATLALEGSTELSDSLNFKIRWGTPADDQGEPLSFTYNFNNRNISTDGLRNNHFESTLLEHNTERADYIYQSNTYNNCILFDVLFEKDTVISVVYSPDFGYLKFKHRDKNFNREI